MADNTADEPLNESELPIPETQPEFPADTLDKAIAPLSEPLFNSTENTEPMEVHHHAHHGHGKKTWKNYFWEFFMLFLAVFCGSLAELQVEHYVEHQREKKYAQTLVEDLKNDTLDLSGDIKGWDRMRLRADTIMMEMEKPVDLCDHRLLYKCVSIINNNNTFLYHDRTIQQLKSSGNFRLIDNKAIADSIVEYDAWIQKTINDIEGTYGRVMWPEIQRLENQLFNTKYFKIVRDSALLDAAFLQFPEKIKMQTGKEDIVFQFYNKVNNHKTLSEARIYYLTATLRRATHLLELLNKEYHFD